MLVEPSKLLHPATAHRVGYVSQPDDRSSSRLVGQPRWCDVSFMAITPGTLSSAWPIGQANGVVLTTNDVALVEHLRQQGFVTASSLMGQLLQRLRATLAAHGLEESTALQHLEARWSATSCFEAERAVSLDDVPAQEAFKAQRLAEVHHAIAEVKCEAVAAGRWSWGPGHAMLVDAWQVINRYRFPRSLPDGEGGCVTSFRTAHQVGYRDVGDVDATPYWLDMTRLDQREARRLLAAIATYLDTQDKVGWDNAEGTTRDPASTLREVWARKFCRLHGWYTSLVARAWRFAMHNPGWVFGKLVVLGVAWATCTWPWLSHTLHTDVWMAWMQGHLGCSDYTSHWFAVGVMFLGVSAVVLGGVHFVQRWRGRSPTASSCKEGPRYEHVGAVPGEDRDETNVFAINPIRRLGLGLREFFGWFHMHGMRHPGAMWVYTLLYVGGMVDVWVGWLPGPLHHANMVVAGGLFDLHSQLWLAASATGFFYGKLWLVLADAFERGGRSWLLWGAWLLCTCPLDVGLAIGGVVWLASIELGFAAFTHGFGRWSWFNAITANYKVIGLGADAASNPKRSLLVSPVYTVGRPVGYLFGPRGLHEVGLSRWGVVWRRVARVMLDGLALVGRAVMFTAMFPFKYVLFPALMVLGSFLNSRVLVPLLQLLRRRRWAQGALRAESATVMRLTAWGHKAEAGLRRVVLGEGLPRFHHPASTAGEGRRPPPPMSVPPAKRSAEEAEPVVGLGTMEAAT